MGHPRSLWLVTQTPIRFNTISRMPPLQERAIFMAFLINQYCKSSQKNKTAWHHCGEQVRLFWLTGSRKKSTPLTRWSYGCMMIPTILWRDQKVKPLHDFKPPSTSSGHPQHEARLQAVAPGHGRKKKKESCRGNPRIVLIFLGSFLAKAARYLTSTSMQNEIPWEYRNTSTSGCSFTCRSSFLWKKISCHLTYGRSRFIGFPTSAYCLSPTCWTVWGGGGM